MIFSMIVNELFRSDNSAYMLICCNCYEEIWDENPDIEDFEEFDKCRRLTSYMICAICKHEFVLDYHLYPNPNFEDTPEVGDLAKSEGKRERE